MKQETRAAATPDSRRPARRRARLRVRPTRRRPCSTASIEPASPVRNLPSRRCCMTPARSTTSNWGDFTLTFDRGRVTYTQRNDLDQLLHIGHLHPRREGDHPSLHRGRNAGETFAARWSLYRDVLTFERTQAELPTPYRPQAVASGRLSGISATRRVPPPGGLSTRSRPCKRLDPVGQAAKARAGRVGATATVVLDLHGPPGPLGARPGRRPWTPWRAWPRWPAPPSRRSRRPPPPSARAAPAGTRSWTGTGESSDSSVRAAASPDSRQGPRVHAAGELGQGGTRALQLPPEVRHRRSAVGEQLGDMGEPALGALAQLPLQAAALGITGLHDPSPGGLDLGDPRPDLRLQPGVGDRDPGGGRHRVDQDRVVQHGGVVDEGADLPVALVKVGDRPGSPRRRAAPPAGPPRRRSRPRREAGRRRPGEGSPTARASLACSVPPCSNSPRSTTRPVMAA